MSEIHMWEYGAPLQGTHPEWLLEIPDMLIYVGVEEDSLLIILYLYHAAFFIYDEELIIIGRHDRLLWLRPYSTTVGARGQGRAVGSINLKFLEVSADCLLLLLCACCGLYVRFHIIIIYYY